MDNRSGLLAAALALFTARGYDAVGVQEVAATAGVAKPTLYHFFGSKLGLLEALFAEYARPLDEAVEAAADYRGDLPASLDRVVRAYLDFSAREPAYYRLELASCFAARDGDPHRLAVAHFTRRQAALEEMFRQAARDHGNMRGRERRYAVSLVGHINAYVALRQDGHLVVTDRIRQDMVHQFSHGIYS